MKKTTYLFSILLLLLSVSCKKNKYSNANWPIDASPVFSDGNIFINISERIDSNGTHFILNCATERIYGCYNVSLTDTFAIVGNIVQLKFLGIYQPQMCLDALGPATDKIELDNLQPGIYDLLISGSGQSVGKLYVDAGQYKIALQTVNGVKFQSYAIRRLPANTIYGSMIYNPAMPGIVNTFIDSLKSIGAYTANLAAGTYSDFIVTEEGKIVSPLDDIANLTRFALIYSGNEDRLYDLVNSFDQGELSINLHTASGRIYHN
ncbi:MAG: hypothetical protein BGO69_06040 [Bacteroidetes bacterium 46-16]|nr:MAG: hypothetical protein BGO69_06040 [Bacteroidetes bacterium 46-16]